VTLAPVLLSCVVVVRVLHGGSSGSDDHRPGPGSSAADHAACYAANRRAYRSADHGAGNRAAGRSRQGSIAISESQSWQGGECQS
jgi:hypothetical protein